jgi:hypothetical protein
MVAVVRFLKCFALALRVERQQLKAVQYGLAMTVNCSNFQQKSIEILCKFCTSSLKKVPFLRFVSAIFG